MSCDAGRAAVRKERERSRGDTAAFTSREKGSYALVLYLSRPTQIVVGSLARVRFPAGIYLYLGSALNGLGPRIGRHLRRKKKPFWHIDYFLSHARIIEIWYCATGERWECTWARAALALPNARVIAPGLGSSDCRCETHLVYLSSAVCKKAPYVLNYARLPL